MWEGSLSEQVLGEFVEAGRLGASEDAVEAVLGGRRLARMLADRERKRAARGTTAERVEGAREALAERRRSLVEKFSALRARGTSNKGIARAANAAGVPTLRGGRRWDATRVLRLLGPRA